jgi:hypothetical protein
MDILMRAPVLLMKAGKLAPGLVGVLCVAVLTSACGTPFGPTGCKEETGTVFDVSGTVPPQGTASYFVTSPWSSNLVMKLTWQDAGATLGLRATIVECGGHTGCFMLATTARDRVKLEQGLLVDGWVGKTYRIDVLGDAAQALAFQVVVVYDISCES